MYWFQSKSFTIDLRLKSVTDTPIVERQAWVGYTHSDAQNASLSWELSSNYQNHTQWPEPATLHTIGNCILEFSPSNAYVEDWRQQASTGLFLGLRLVKAVHDVDAARNFARWRSRSSAVSIWHMHNHVCPIFNRI